MNKFSKLLIGTVIALATVPAAAKSPFYIGADIGGANMQYKDDAESVFPSNFLAGNVNAGFDINEYVAIELGYFSTNTQKKDGISFQYSGPTLDVVGNVPVAENVSILASAGAVHLKAEIEELDVSEEETKLKLGAGLKYKINDSLSLRTKVDYIDASSDDSYTDSLWIYTAGIQYHL